MVQFHNSRFRPVHIDRLAAMGPQPFGRAPNLFRPITVIGIDHDDIEPMSVALHANSLRVVDVEGDSKGAWMFARPVIGPISAQVRIMDILVNYPGDSNAMASQPAAHRPWRAMGCRVYPQFPAISL
jgi:hypothetical protein